MTDSGGPRYWAPRRQALLVQETALAYSRTRPVFSAARSATRRRLTGRVCTAGQVKWRLIDRSAYASYFADEWGLRRTYCGPEVLKVWTRRNRGTVSGDIGELPGARPCDHTRSANVMCQIGSTPNQDPRRPAQHCRL